MNLSFASIASPVKEVSLICWRKITAFICPDDYKWTFPVKYSAYQTRVGGNWVRRSYGDCLRQNTATMRVGLDCFHFARIVPTTVTVRCNCRQHFQLVGVLRHFLLPVMVCLTHMWVSWSR